MIVNIHDGPWQCATCRLVYTRHVDRCDTCGNTSIVHCSMKAAWGDDVTAICQGLVAIQGEQGLTDMRKELDRAAQVVREKLRQEAQPQPAKPSPCQPDPFPMLQASVLSAVLESWAVRCGGQGPVSLESHLAAVRCRVDELAGITAIIARAMLKLSRDG